jgi:four helix bundle protein
MEQAFEFERLEVYRVAREALHEVLRCRQSMRGAPGELRSQLERAMVSVVNNIAEGAGRESIADKRRHYAIARGSATEAGNSVEIAFVFGAIGDDDRAAMRSRLLRVTWMLTAMLRR